MNDNPMLWVGGAILLLGMGAVVGGTLVDPASDSLFDVVLAFYANAGSELISIAITVLIIDRLNERRDRRERQQELEDNTALQERIAKDLKRQLRFYMQGRALSALRQARDHHERQPILDEMAFNRLLHGIDLTNANLERAGLWGVAMRRAKLRGANLSRARFKNARLLQVDLRDCNLTYAELRGILLKGAQMKGADLSFADLRRADVSKMTMVGQMMKQCDLRGADLREADLQSATLTESQCAEADFSGACLIGAFCERTMFEGALLAGADLRGIKMNEAMLEGADLTGADLRGAFLERTVLLDVRGLTPEQLQAAASLGGATLPDGTVLPTNDAWRGALQAWVARQGASSTSSE